MVVKTLFQEFSVVDNSRDLDILNTNESVVPNLLRILIECLIEDKVKRAGISQALMQSCRPRTVMLPLPFALGVHLDRFGSSELIKEVSRLEFCISHDEVNRFKQSVMQYDIRGERNADPVTPFLASLLQTIWITTFTHLTEVDCYMRWV
jgi:hypothetical protein